MSRNAPRLTAFQRRFMLSVALSENVKGAIFAHDDWNTDRAPTRHALRNAGLLRSAARVDGVAYYITPEGWEWLRAEAPAKTVAAWREARAYFAGLRDSWAPRSAHESGLWADRVAAVDARLAAWGEA